MSNKAITWAYNQKHAELKSNTKFVLLALADLADSEHSCYPGVEEIARMTAMGASTVKRHLETLVELQFITRERRHRKDGSRTSNRYYLAVDTTETQQPESGFGDGADQVPVSNDLSPELGDPKSRIGRGILEPPVNPQNEPSDEELIELPAELSIDDHFEEFWRTYPRRAGRASAKQKFIIAARNIRPAALIAAAATYRDDPRRNADLTFVPYPATWLHQERWLDELPDTPPRVDQQSAFDHNQAIAEQLRKEANHGSATNSRFPLGRIEA